MSTDWETVSATPFKRVKMRMDASEDRIYTRVEQSNVKAILDDNSRARNADRKSTALTNPGALMGDPSAVFIARVPDVVLEEWWQKYRLNIYRTNDPETQALLGKLLNDLDYSKLKRAPGRI